MARVIPLTLLFMAGCSGAPAEQTTDTNDVYPPVFPPSARADMINELALDINDKLGIEKLSAKAVAMGGNLRWSRLPGQFGG